MTGVTGRLPSTYAAADLPDRVSICEVGPRDGLQNEPIVVAADVKVEFIARLAAAGLRRIEATSFVSPRRVPQLADAEAVMAGLPLRDFPDVRFPVLVPNIEGLDRALALGVHEIAIFGSATETFARRNLNRSIDGSVDMFRPVVAAAARAGVRVRAYLSMCFGDPWEGPVPIQQVVEVGHRMLDLGCDELSLGDTIGVGTAGHVTALVDALGAHGIPPGLLGVHFHDTYGQALSNTVAALRAGVTTVDASAGGLGGCPFAESATGNLATEDLVWLLDGLGIETGVDLSSLVRTSVWMAGILGRPSPSRVVNALAPALADHPPGD
jgi:hydroxymethylglutaryl-CoA lyase